MTHHRKYRKRYRKRHRRSRGGMSPESFAFILVGTLVVLLAIFSAPKLSLQVDLLSFLPLGLILFGIVALIVVLRRAKVEREEEERFEGYRVLADIQQMDPFEFEHYVGWLFRHLGYRVTVTVRQGDHGLDLVMFKKGQKMVVQVKRYHSGHRVSEPEVRDFYGSFIDSGAIKGFFVTTSNFTEEARSWINKGQKPISLVDGSVLMKIIRRVGHTKEFSWRENIMHWIFLPDEAKKDDWDREDQDDEVI